MLVKKLVVAAAAGAVLLSLTPATGADRPASRSPVDVDICVYAATPSGILAAVAAAREGRGVTIVEPSRWVGGVLGAGIKPAQDCPNRQAVGGLTVDVFARAGQAPAPVRRYFRELLAKHEIPVIFEHRVRSVDKDGLRIARLHLEKAPPDQWGCPVAGGEPGPGITVQGQLDTGEMPP